LIIYLKDNKELFKVDNIANYENQFYIYLKHQNLPKENHKEENPLVVILYPKTPKDASYNLSNKHQLEILPEDVNNYKCSRVENFNLGMKFKLDVEKEDSWEVYYKQKFPVEE